MSRIYEFSVEHTHPYSDTLVSYIVVCLRLTEEPLGQ